MLPKTEQDGSMTKIKWKIVKPNKDGKIKCLDCPKTFVDMHNAKVHQYKCFNLKLEKSRKTLIAGPIGDGRFKCLNCKEIFSRMIAIYGVYSRFVAIVVTVIETCIGRPCNRELVE